MITQVFAMQNAEEALKTIEAGADYIGFAPILQGEGRPDHKTEIPDSVAREIMRATEGKAVRIALSVGDNGEEFLELARRYRPEIVHISGSGFETSREFYQRFKSLFPEIRLLQAIQVDGWQAVERARRLAQYADMLILDSAVPGNGRVIGASGLVHGRAVDREIVRTVSVPVVVAGGLDETNVEQVVREVRPFGVDTLSKTNRWENGCKTNFKDFEEVRLFCQRAKSAAAQL